MKTIICKILILVAILLMSIVFIATHVLAADDVEENLDLTNLLGNSSNTANTSNTTNTNPGNTNSSNTANVNLNTNLSNTNSNTNNTNSSLYNNTNLPKTGLSDTLPVVVLVVVGGISAVYAYKKINDYRNI